MTAYFSKTIDTVEFEMLKENYKPTIVYVVKLSFHNEIKIRANKTKIIYLKKSYTIRKTKESSSGWKEIIPDGNLQCLQAVPCTVKAKFWGSW